LLAAADAQINALVAKADRGEGLAEALREFIDGMKAGTVRPKGRDRHKPNTTAPTTRRSESISSINLSGFAVFQLGSNGTAQRELKKCRVALGRTTGHQASGQRAALRSGADFWLHKQKTPRREGGAFLGLLQGGEICISIYVDLWEVGRDP
jgi:hypothetical protein